MDDHSDGLSARSTDDCSHSERIEFSSGNVMYTETIWPPAKAGQERVTRAKTTRARSRIQPASSAQKKSKQSKLGRSKTHSNGSFHSDLSDIIIGSSKPAEQLRERIRLYATDDAPVLIIGETGVGKELVARQLHELGPRNDQNFIPLNIGAVPESLSASELFGHKKGAFTGAHADHDGAFLSANHGSLFLDEIGDTPSSIQAQLLRVLDDGMVTRLGERTPQKVDLRLIAATHVNLNQAVKDNQFRQDLFYRINVLVIEVPPLRDRGDDVIEIAEAMIASHPNEAHRNKRLTPNAVAKLMAHPFPGNVRELRNVLMRALVHAHGPRILEEHITFMGNHCTGLRNDDCLNVSDAKELISRFLMIKALKLADGNISKAAKLSGRSRGTIHTLKNQLNGEDLTSVYKSACAQLKALIGDC